jgi:hypothetical protein
MDNVVIAVSNPLLYLKFAKRVDFKLFSSHTHTSIHKFSCKGCLQLDWDISLIGINILQCRSIPSHHIVYLKCIQLRLSKGPSKSGGEDIIYKVQESQVEKRNGIPLT